MYWSQKTRVEKVAQVMSCDRCENIKNNLHLNDNDLLSQSKGKDKLFKLQAFIDMLLPKFQGLPKTQMLVAETVPPQQAA